MSDLSIHCNSCDESTPWQTSPNLAKKGKSFDVNRRAVYHSIETGSGYEGLSSFCAIMNMPWKPRRVRPTYRRKNPAASKLLWPSNPAKHLDQGKSLWKGGWYCSLCYEKNIITILHHCVKSSDNAKQHRFCPPGDSSWCKWQQDQATGTSTYKGDDCLPELFLEALKPIFVSLSHSKLLERCVWGKTQNPNKSINATVCVRCPKHKHNGVKVVRCAAASPICHFHRGAESRERLMERLSISGGALTRNAFRLTDKSRLRKANKQATAKEKKHRQGLQLFRTEREAALREKEDVTNEPGAFLLLLLSYPNEICTYGYSLTSQFEYSSCLI